MGDDLISTLLEVVTTIQLYFAASSRCRDVDGLTLRRHFIGAYIISRPSSYLTHTQHVGYAHIPLIDGRVRFLSLTRPTGGDKCMLFERHAEGSVISDDSRTPQSPAQSPPF